MTPAEFHFISRITEVAKNLTLRNVTVNTTGDTIMSAEVSELKTPMFWIQLGLIPLPPIFACYLFTKVADYIGSCITKFRQPRVELRPLLHPNSQAISHSDGFTTDRIEEDTRNFQRTHGIDQNHGSTSQATKVRRFRRQIEQNEPSGRLNGGDDFFTGARVSKGIAKDHALIGKDNIHGAAEGISLTRDRPGGDAKRGFGIHGRVGSNSQNMKKDGWWFDARWN